MGRASANDWDHIFTNDWAYQFGIAFARQNAMMLDNLGIRIKMDELPTWPAYRQARQAYYGAGWLDRLWCQRLRRWLMPKRHRGIEARWLEAERRHEQAFLSAVLDAGKAKLADDEEKPECRN